MPETKFVDRRNKRTKGQRTADRSIIAGLIIEGKKIHEIRDHINDLRDYDLSMTSIYKDMKLVQKQWVEEYLSDINTAKAKELARIDRIEKEAWRAWDESKRDIKKTEKERIENEQIGKNEQPFHKHRKVRAKTTQTERDADKEFMKIVQWCVETRCKILGINAPQRYDISWRKQAQAAGVDPDKVKQDLVNQFVAHAERGLVDEPNSDDD